MSDESFNTPGEAVEAAPEAVDTTVAADANPVTSTEEGEPPPEPKTFTQEELTKIVNKENAKTERRLRREWEAAQVEAQRPSLNEPPDPKNFKSDDDYFEAVIDHRAEMKLAQREFQKQQVDANLTYGDRADAAREKYHDFEMAHKSPSEGGPSITPEMAAVIKGSELGPEIAYHLYKNLGESRRICNLSPLQQAMEIGKIEVILKNTPAPVKKASSAPPPITPVASRSSHSQTYDPTDPRSDKMSVDDWMKARNQQIMKRAQG